MQTIAHDMNDNGKKEATFTPNIEYITHIICYHLGLMGNIPKNVSLDELKWSSDCCTPHSPCCSTSTTASVPTIDELKEADT